MGRYSRPRATDVLIDVSKLSGQNSGLIAGSVANLPPVSQRVDRLPGSLIELCQSFTSTLQTVLPNGLAGYLALFPNLSTATASRDLHKAIDESRLKSSSERAQTVYQFRSSSYD